MVNLNELLSQGKDTFEIAAALQVTTHTVHSYYDRMKVKLNLAGCTIFGAMRSVTSGSTPAGSPPSISVGKFDTSFVLNPPNLGDVCLLAPGSWLLTPISRRDIRPWHAGTASLGVAPETNIIAASLVRKIEMHDAADTDILEYAARESLVVIMFDRDFPQILALNARRSFLRCVSANNDCERLK